MDCGTDRAISFSADSTESEPWQMLRPTARQKSPRMEPNAKEVGKQITKYALQRALTDRGLEGVGSTEHDATGLDGVESLPDHADDGAGCHVLDQTGEERLALEIGIVCVDVSVMIGAIFKTPGAYGSRGAPR